MKTSTKTFLFFSLLLLNQSNIRAEFSYMDGMSRIKATTSCRTFKASDHRFLYFARSSKMVPNNVNLSLAIGAYYAVAYLPVVLSTAEYKVGNDLPRWCLDPLQKTIQYNAWYGDTGNTRNDKLYRPLVSSVIEPTIFLAADRIVDTSFKRSETVQNALLSVPEKDRAFVFSHGKFVVAAGIARAGGALAAEGTAGLNAHNAKSFGKLAVKHVSSEALEHYLINPAVENLVGPSNNSAIKSITKTALCFAANGVAFMAIDSLAQKL